MVLTPQICESAARGPSRAMTPTRSSSSANESANIRRSGVSTDLSSAQAIGVPAAEGYYLGRPDTRLEQAQP